MNDKIELAVVSSKGQLVVPKNIREKMHIEEGSLLTITAYPDKDMIVFRTVKKPDVKEELMIIKETEKAWKELEEGKFKRSEKHHFLKELEKW